MAKKSSIDSFYEKAGRDLKKLGIISYPDLKSLSPQQKGRITRLMGVPPPPDKWAKMNDAQRERFHRDAKYKEVVLHPENFHIAKVSKGTAKKFRESGYLGSTKKSTLFIPLNTSERGKFDSARISKGKIIYKGGGITETVFPSTAKDFHKTLERIAKRPLNNNQMVTLKIGDNASFNSRFESLADLYKYVREEFKPKGATLAQLSRYVSLVDVEKRSGKNGLTQNSSGTKTGKKKGRKKKD